MLASINTIIVRTEDLIWFCKVHNAECIFSVFLCVSHSEVKPLLVTLSVGIYLHVELILSGAYHVCLEEIPTFKDRIKN